MSKQRKEKCTACGGKGWFFWNTGNDQTSRYEIQRCDVCEQFASDRAALEAVERAVQTQPELHRFAETVSRLTHEGEPGEEGQPHQPRSEDAIATLNQLIMDARQLLGTAEKCSECGQTVPFVIGCPDGAEICQDCFEAGRH